MLGAVGTSRSEQAGCVSSCHWLPWGRNEVQVEPRQHVQPGRSGPEEECVCLVLLSSERSCPQLACSPECAWERGSEARPGRREGSGLSSENSSFGSEVAFISRSKGTGDQGRVEQERNVFIVEPSRRAWVSILRWNLSNFPTLLVAVLRFFSPQCSIQSPTHANFLPSSCIPSCSSIFLVCACALYMWVWVEVRGQPQVLLPRCHPPCCYLRECHTYLELPEWATLAGQ